MKFNYYIPTRILFGKGMLNRLSRQELPGKKALIVTTGGTSVKKYGYLARVEEQLDKAGAEHLLFDKILPNPIKDHVMEGAALAKANGVDFVVGLGGGSAIDAAKGIAIAAGHLGKIWDFAPTPSGGRQAITGATLPVVAVTTTSGTGSHVTQYVVITNPETKEKPGFGCDYTWARHAIIDPELMLSLPPRITESTGFDVFCHALEAYPSRMSTPISDLYAEWAISIVGRYLREAVIQGGSLEARSQMALADTLAGIAISMGGVTNCHAVAHAAGGIDNVVHGEFLAALAPVVYEYDMRSNPDKYKVVGKLLNPAAKTEGRSDEELLAGSIDEIRALLRDIGLDKTLREVGVGPDVRAIAEATVAYMGVGLDNDYQTLDAADITRLLEKAY